MRIMVLAATGDVADDLARELADGQEVATISIEGRLSSSDGKPPPDLEQELDRQLPGQGFVIKDGPATPEQAVMLDSLLDALDVPLELVIRIDTAQEAPVGYAADLDHCLDPLSEYYRARGLLRRVRSVGETRDILAAARRIVDDLARAQRSADGDPFTATLQAIARDSSAPRKEGSTMKEPEAAAESTRPSPGWKRTAAQKGRLRRQPGNRKGRQKFRR